MPVEPTRMLRGALAGAVAAGASAAQSPLDRRVFGVDYDDPELLGKALTRGPAARPLGLAAHVLNGAAFGAVYSAAAPSVPVAPWARGPLAGAFEGVATWPLVAVIERVHPARDELPQMWGSRHAFAQMLWRHVFFGALLGELERRLNPPEDAEEPPSAMVVSTNGHGRVEALVTAAD
ncbi:MAG: hypothetical protein ACR2HD_01225 [Solirubrobacteraceae bacterium]